MNLFTRVLKKADLRFNFPSHSHVGRDKFSLLFKRNTKYPSFYFDEGRALSLMDPQLVFGRNLFSTQLMNYYDYGLEDNHMFLPLLVGYMKKRDSTKPNGWDYRLIYHDFASDIIHLQNSGITGSGKTSGIYCLLFSLMWLNLPKWLKISIFSTKGFAFFDDICNVHVTIPEMRKGAEMLVNRLHERMQQLNNQNSGRFHEIELYNEAHPKDLLRYEVIVLDEFSNILRALEGDDRNKFIENIEQIASQGRSLGMHLVVMPQRADVKGLPSGIKSQLPSSMTFRLKSIYDAQTANCEEAITLKRGEAVLDSLVDRGRLNMLHMPKNYPAFFAERIKKNMEINGFPNGFK